MEVCFGHDLGILLIAIVVSGTSDLLRFGQKNTGVHASFRMPTCGLFALGCEADFGYLWYKDNHKIH
jgi:hypothetical protein